MAQEGLVHFAPSLSRSPSLAKLPKADIELINIASDKVESVVESDSITGEYLMVLTQGSEYALYVNKPGYLFRSLNFNYSEVKDFEPIVLDIELEKATEGSVSVLKNIFFKTNEYQIEDKSKTELVKMIRFLNANPSIRIEISGHTDNVGTAAYNSQLSEKRAQAVVDFLASNGIDSRRLVAKGYGQDHPVASNDTEEGRQANRRIEFKVLK